MESRPQMPAHHLPCGRIDALYLNRNKDESELDTGPLTKMTRGPIWRADSIIWRVTECQRLPSLSTSITLPASSTSRRIGHPGRSRRGHDEKHSSAADREPQTELSCNHASHQRCQGES